MEQKPLSPDHGPDLPPVIPASSGETAAPSLSPEIHSEDSAERQEQQSEAVHASGGPALPAVSSPLPTALPSADDTVTDSSQPIQGSSPAIANDDELIEKEWVDRAKKVIAETKDDPYRREQEVNRLQADYLLKRYGRELGSL